MADSMQKAKGAQCPEVYATGTSNRSASPSAGVTSLFSRRWIVHVSLALTELTSDQDASVVELSILLDQLGRPLSEALLYIVLKALPLALHVSEPVRIRLSRERGGIRTLSCFEDGGGVRHVLFLELP
jgi:hypothetical protein